MEKFRHLILLLILSVIGIAASAKIYKPFESNGIVFCVTDDEAMTATVCKPINTDYKFYSGMVNVPATVEYEGQTYTVTTVDAQAFRGQSELTTLILPKTIERIEMKACLGAPSLKSVNLANLTSLQYIGEQAFSGCKNLTSISLPNSLIKIGDYGFEYCAGVKSIKWGTSLETIGKAAFKGCDNIVEVELPESVKTVGELAFWECNKLKKADLGAAVYVGPNAFLDDHALEEVIIPNTVKEMGYEVFRGCWVLPKIEIPNSVTTIGYGFCRFCVSLSEVKLSESLTEIPGWCFEQTALKSITIPDNVKSIMPFAFQECSELAEVNFGSGLQSIGDSSFELCNSLTHIELPDQLTRINQYAFMKCANLSTVTIPASTYFIGEEAFAYCPNLANVYDLALEPQNLWVGTPVFYQSGPDGRVNVHVYEDLYEAYSTTLGWYDINPGYTSYINIVPDLKQLAVESIEILDAPYYCKVGELMHAKAKVLPANAANKVLSWTSSDESILYVDEFTGDFIGFEEGTVTLTATATDGSGVTASTLVYIGDHDGIESIKVDEGSQMIIYDIYGRRLQQAQPGLNIINGKKVYVK